MHAEHFFFCISVVGKESFIPILFPHIRIRTTVSGSIRLIEGAIELPDVIREEHRMPAIGLKKSVT